MKEENLNANQIEKINKIYWTMTKEILLPISRVNSNMNQDLEHRSDFQNSKQIIAKSKEEKEYKQKVNINSNLNQNTRPQKNVSFNDNVNTRVFNSYNEQNGNQMGSQDQNELFNLNMSGIDLSNPYQNQPQNAIHPVSAHHSTSQPDLSNLSMDSGRSNSWLRFQQQTPGITRQLDLDEKIFEEMYDDALSKKELEQGVDSVHAFKLCLRRNLTDLQIVEVQKMFKLRQVQVGHSDHSMDDDGMGSNSEQREDSVDGECCICKESNVEKGEDCPLMQKEGLVLHSCWHYFHSNCLAQGFKASQPQNFKCPVCNQLLDNDDFGLLDDFVSKYHHQQSFADQCNN